MHWSWVANNSWPLRRCTLEIQTFVVGLPIENKKVGSIKTSECQQKPSLTLVQQKFKKCYLL